MTDKNIKIMLLASLITAIVLPLSAVSAANADAELTDSERRFEQFIMLAEQQQKLQMIVDGLIDQDESSDIISNLEKRIDSLQKRMDVMQQQEIDSVSMDSEELESLTAKGYVILDEVTNPTSIHFIDKDADFFVDQSTKQIIVVVDDKPPDGILGQGTPAGNSDAQREHTIGDVSFLVDKIKQSSSVVTCDEREKDCRYGLGGIAIKQGRETSSLGFSAKQVDGDRGFVTVSHGVNYKGAIVKQYPSRDIGTVDVITKDDRTECDCAFVKVTNDDFKTTYRIHIDDNKYSSIKSYATDYPSINTWLMMSGVGSGVQYGQFKGLLEKSDRMAVTYKSQNGDSGAPVSTIGSGVKLYGMHTSNGIYSYSTPYKTIKTDLGLA